jgi:hypothetical protein
MVVGFPLIIAPCPLLEDNLFKIITLIEKRGHVTTTISFDEIFR